MDTCPVCSWPFSNGNFKLVAYPVKSREHDRDETPDSIRFCGRCGLGVASPPFSGEKLDELYVQGKYWQKRGQETSLRIFPVPFGLAQTRWRLIEKSIAQSKRIKKVRVLDIGAGHGYIGLVASASRNVSVGRYDAVEPDPVMRQYLQNLWKAWERKQRLSFVDSIEQTTGNYDIVVLSHILEHARDPLYLVKSAVARLSTKGLLFIDVPNQDYLFKEDVFPHNLFFSLPSLRFLLEKEPLEIISIGTWGRNMYKSPLHTNAPRSLKIIGEIAGRSGAFLPGKFLVPFYAWYFGVNSMDTNGTWIRALCRRK